jgi:predicted Ser/Thr protein kinase
VEELGQGGRGVVYKARHLALKRTVALKMIRAGGGAGPEERARFQTEAEAVARLQHPNIVQIYEVGEHDGRPFFSMEFVEGGSLDRKRQGQPWPPREAARLVEQLACAMHDVHQKGVVHRDLKPANILLTAGGVPKVADFGWAKLLAADAAGLTSPGRPLGTWRYMAPEQADGRAEATGQATDVFGLGGILYELLTGRPPHQGSTPEDVVREARECHITPPRRLERSVPRRLERISLRALAADPHQRYPSAAALAADLRSYLGRPRRIMLAGAVAGACLASLLVFLLARHFSPGPPPEFGPLSGKLNVLVTTPGGKGKKWLWVDEAGALPVCNGEWLQVEVQLNQPAHVYLLYLDGEGLVTPFYPWNDNEKRELRAKLTDPPPRRPPTDLVYSPRGKGWGWRVEGPSGLETVLLLAGRTPLPPEVSLGRLIGKPPRLPLADPLELAVLSLDARQKVEYAINDHRGVGSRAQKIDDPLLALMDRLQEHFEMIRAVRFAHRGD